MYYYAVALPLPFAGPLTYQYEKPLHQGEVVCVPLGKKELWGIVWEAPAAPREAKPIHSVHPHIVLQPETVTFLKKAHQYTMMPLGLLIRLVLPNVQYAFTPTFLYSATGPLPKKTAVTEATTIEDWAERTHSRASTILSWIEKGLLVAQEAERTIPIATRSPLVLTEEQQSIVEGWDPQKPYLIQGVAGSGKTEVGLWLASEAWKRGEQVLILVPEIGLCTLWEKRLQKYFDVPVTLWHSGLSRGERQKSFERLAQGQAAIIIGARSALFLPYKNLGLLLVDEEHDGSYKQEERGRYQARDMAILRAHYEKVPIVLLSATPCIETLWNVQRGSYQQGTLTTRYHRLPVPSLTLIDMRLYPVTPALSPPMRTCLEETLQRKEQSLLFINRRGYAPLLLCYTCGHRSACPHCSVWLTIHHKKRLLCHHCGFEEVLPPACPNCQKETLLTHGLGVEKILEEVQAFLPEARVALLSSDVPQAEAFDLLKRIEAQEIDIVVGTQMVAKGHHFPNLTSIGIIDADFALGDLDLRAQERLYQVLSQVVGRSGREKKAGMTVLQTLQPQHPFFKELSDPTAFVQREMEKRKIGALPPFTRLVALILSGPKEHELESAALTLKKYAPKHAQVQVLGPAPAPLNPLRKHYRWRFLIKATRTFPVQQFVSQWLSCAKLPSAISTHIDIDPYSFL